LVEEKNVKGMYSTERMQQLKNKNCKIHTIRTKKKDYNKNQQNQRVKEKDISVLGGIDLFCATRCAIQKESDVPLLENRKTNARENVKMM
jgi:hypothetical protein